MKRTRITFSLLLTCLISLWAATPALAFPPLPSSFYGTVRINGSNVPDGTLVQALINGQAFGQGLTQPYQGTTIYSLDIPGDDLSTPTLEGGHEGDTVHFEIGGVPASQTAVWHSGTNILMHLTASTSAQTPVWTPLPTHTPPATRTRLPTIPLTPTPTSTPTPTEHALPTASRPAPTATASPAPGVLPTTAPTATATAALTRSPSPSPARTGAPTLALAPTTMPPAMPSSPASSPATARSAATPTAASGAAAPPTPVQPPPTHTPVSSQQAQTSATNDRTDSILGLTGIMLVMAGAVIGAISFAGLAVCVVLGMASRKRSAARADNREIL